MRKKIIALLLLIGLWVIVLPASAQGTYPYTLDTVAADTISAGGEQDTYTFDLTAGERYIFDYQTAAYGTYWVLKGPSNQEVFNAGLSDRDLTAPETGTYTLIIANSQAAGTGAYSFRIWTETTDNHGSITLDNTTINSDSISNPGEYDIYTFDATLSEVIIFDYDTATYGTYWVLKGPSNQEVFNAGLGDREITAPQTGTYTLTIANSQPTGTGAYTFRLWTETTENRGSITLDNTTIISDTISQPGQYLVYTFDATASQVIIFDAQSTVYGIYWVLKGPSNQEIFNDHLTDRQITAPQTGTYTLTLANFQPTGTGAYTFQLWIKTTDDRGQVTINNVDVSVDNISQPGQYDVYHFYAESGDNLTFDSQSAVYGTYWVLRGPSKQEIFNAGLSDRTLAVSQTGCYKLTVANNQPTGTGAYSFQITTDNIIASPGSCPPPNTAPVAVNDVYNAPLNTQIKINAASGVLANDTDENGDVLTAVNVTVPSNGTLVFNADGSFDYTPNSNFSGTDAFTYYATDSDANSNTATVNIIVSLNTAPIANVDGYTTDFQTPLTISNPGVLSNDTDADSNALTASLVSGAGHGLVILNANGSFTYTPNNGFYGNDTFTYKANDGTVDSNTAMVTIVVNVIIDPDKPTILPPGGNTNQGTILPTFSWVLASDGSGNPKSDEWFNLLIKDGNGNVLLDEWFKTGPYCTGLTCNFTPSTDLFPYGLLEGDYEWQVITWSRKDGQSDPSATGTFNIDLDAPEIPENVDVSANTGDVIVSWDDDPTAAWFHVVIKDNDGNVIYDNWHDRSEVVCDGNRCTFVVPVDPDNGAIENGDYSVTVQAWGAGGFNNNSATATSAQEAFAVDNGAVGALSEQLADYYLTNTNSGEPTFGWIPAANSTWTLLYIGAHNQDGSYTTQYITWHQVSEMTCPNGTSSTCLITPDLIFLPNGVFEWWMVGWGPAGFGEWAKSPINVVVDANSPALAVPMTPTNTTLSDDYFTFQWDQVENISWYEIWLGNSNGETFYLNWLRDRDVCISGICSVTPPDLYLPDGDYVWYMQTYNPGWTGDNWNLSKFGEFTIDTSP